MPSATFPDRPSGPRARPGSRRRRRPNQSGSATVLTVLGIGVLAGAFLYVAVVGSRAGETARVRVAADATAMAAATVKAKVMNDEAYILLADTALLPLAQIADRIGEAQVLGAALCPWVMGAGYCVGKYARHVAGTQSRRPAARRAVTTWLDGLAETADRLRTVGPQWAEAAAARAGTARDYKGPGARGVTAAASFPVPDLDPASACTKLGIELADNGTRSRDGASRRDACHDERWLEPIYVLASADPQAAALDEAGMVLTGSSLLIGASCAAKSRAPRLAADWKDYSVSRGLAISEAPGDRLFQGRLESLRGTTPPRNLETGYLMGMACAEHYARDHHGEESLWHMDWRARLAPCEFEKERNSRPLRRCGAQSAGALHVGPGHVAKMQLQFERQRLLGVARFWKF